MNGQNKKLATFSIQIWIVLTDSFMILDLSRPEIKPVFTLD
jgi:hypothetical protein